MFFTFFSKPLSKLIEAPVNLYFRISFKYLFESKYGKGSNILISNIITFDDVENTVTKLYLKYKIYFSLVFYQAFFEIAKL